MKITVQRSGGVAGFQRVWSTEPATQDAVDRWQGLIEACPWDDLPGDADEAPQPDRFVYSIRAGRRRATLPERHITGPWRELVECVRADAGDAPRE